MINDHLHDSGRRAFRAGTCVGIRGVYHSSVEREFSTAHHLWKKGGKLAD